MYRLEASPNDSGSASETPKLLASLGIVIGLGLVGVLSVVLIGFYLPAVATKAYWLISRSSGSVAYVLLAAGMLWGLMQSGSLFRRRFAPLLTLGMHSYLSWLGLGMAALHGLILMGDSYIHTNLLQITVPFMSEYRPLPVGLGIIGFYLMLLLSLSFYARRYLGQRAFRTLHYVSFAVFALVTVHGVYAGTDTGAIWWLYALSMAAVVSMTALRIWGARRAKQKPPTRPAGVRTADTVRIGVGAPAMQYQLVRSAGEGEER